MPEEDQIEWFDPSQAAEVFANVFHDGQAEPLIHRIDMKARQHETEPLAKPVSLFHMPTFGGGGPGKQQSIALRLI